MQVAAHRPTPLRVYGPWLVALGAALWGTENYWRYYLLETKTETGELVGLGYDPTVMVFLEHLLQLPFWILLTVLLVPKLYNLLRNIPAKAYVFLLFSGIIGSAVGTVFFTAALRDGNATVVSVIPSVQPVFSTLMAVLLFRDRLSKWFYLLGPAVLMAGFWIGLGEPGKMKDLLVQGHLWQPLYASVLIGVVACWLLCFGLLWVVRTRWIKILVGCTPLVLLVAWVVASGHAAELRASLEAAQIWSKPVGYAFLCAVCWGLSTVAGRGAMLHIPPLLGATLRVLIGLVTVLCIVVVQHKLTGAQLLPPKAHLQIGYAVLLFVGLSTLSGGIPTLIYFAGLRRTRASVAGYFEMVQILAGVLVSWGFLGHTLNAYQLTAAVALLLLVACLQWFQQREERLHGLS